MSAVVRVLALWLLIAPRSSGAAPGGVGWPEPEAEPDRAGRVADRPDTDADPVGDEIIEVSGTAPEDTRPPTYVVTAEDIRSLPGAGNDVLRAMQAMPGVARLPYALGGLVLRGTSPRDTAVFVDGVEVPIAFHFGGVSSVYPSGMLANVALVNGGFDVSYGRAIGGIATLTTREPRTDRWRVGGAIGLLDSGAQAEGPLPGGGGMLVGMRRSYLDAVVRSFVPEDTPLPSYLDAQVRTSWGDPRRRGRVAPLLFMSLDRITSDNVAVTSMFVRAAAPITRQWKLTTVRLVPWLGVNVLRLHDVDTDESYSRPVLPAGLRGEVVRDVAWGHIRGGVELHGGHASETEVSRPDDPGNRHRRGRLTLAWTDVALWTELRVSLAGDRFSFKPGVRAEAYGLSSELVIDPRLTLHQRVRDGLILRQAIGRYHQPPTLGDVDRKDGNPALDGSYADQLSLGVEASLPYAVIASATAFGSRARGLAVRATDPVRGNVPSPHIGGLDASIALLLDKQLGIANYREGVGNGRSAGLELFARRTSERWFAMLSYTLSFSQRTDHPDTVAPGLRPGAWRPFELDQRHNLQLVAQRRFTRWRLGARLQLVSGNPYSPETFDGTTGTIDPWGANLPTFAALDLRVDRRWRRCWGDINLYVDVHNVLNRRNVEARELTYDETTRRWYTADVLGLPILPFIGVEYQPPSS